MAIKIALSIEKVLRRKVDPISKEWQEKNKLDNQRHIECNLGKNETENHQQAEPTHEASLLEYITALDKNDCPDSKNPDDADTMQDKTPSTDNKEIRCSIRSKKLPASRYGDFFMGDLNRNPKVITGRLHNSQHSAEAAKQLNFKPDRNHDQVNNASMNKLLHDDFLIFH